MALNLRHWVKLGKFQWQLYWEVDDPTAGMYEIKNYPFCSA